VTLKILDVCENFRDESLKIIPFRSHYQHLQDALARAKEDVVFYGLGKGLKQETDVAKMVEDEKSDVVFIMGSQDRYSNIEKVNVPKFLFCSDSWSNVLKHVEFLNRNKFTGAFILYPCAIPYYKKFGAKCELYPLPYAVDTSVFNDRGLEREYDVFCSGSFDAETHPIRHALLDNQKKLSRTMRIFLGIGHSLDFEEYVRKLNQSKIFCFDNVNLRIPRLDPTAPRLNFAIEKWVEAMACNMLALAPEPSGAESLYHFEDGFNFVDVNLENFTDKIRYYLDHEDERLRIAKNGLDTILKYHTVEIRVGQMLDVFRKTLEGK
jgi:spore maturation protein CgeB